MTQEEILEGNKLIAEFMGFKKHDEYIYEAVEEKYFIPTDIKNGCVNSYGYVFPINCLMFHSSWDWLKPVIDKISEIDYTKYPSKCIEYISVVAMSILTPIEEAFKRVINFIKWYNLNK